MYDILQLNDMLVPELLDIAEQLKIPSAKKLDKQELIYKILDKQAVMASETKGTDAADKTKRKRIVKASTAHSTEEAFVESESEKPRKLAEHKKPLARKEEPTPARKFEPAVKEEPARKEASPARPAGL